MRELARRIQFRQSNCWNITAKFDILEDLSPMISLIDDHWWKVHQLWQVLSLLCRLRKLSLATYFKNKVASLLVWVYCTYSSNLWKRLITRQRSLASGWGFLWTRSRRVHVFSKYVIVGYWNRGNTHIDDRRCGIMFEYAASSWNWNSNIFKSVRYLLIKHNQGDNLSPTYISSWPSAQTRVGGQI